MSNIQVTHAGVLRVLSRLQFLPGGVALAVICWAVTALLADVPGPPGEMIAAGAGLPLVQSGVWLLRLPITWRTHSQLLRAYAFLAVLVVLGVGVFCAPHSRSGLILTAVAVNLLAVWLVASLRQPGRRGVGLAPRTPQRPDDVDPPIGVHMITPGGDRIALDCFYVGSMGGNHVWEVIQPVADGTRVGVDLLPPRTKIVLSGLLIKPLTA